MFLQKNKIIKRLYFLAAVFFSSFVYSQNTHTNYVYAAMSYGDIPVDNSQNGLFVWSPSDFSKVDDIKISYGYVGSYTSLIGSSSLINTINVANNPNAIYSQQDYSYVYISYDRCYLNDCDKWGVIENWTVSVRIENSSNWNINNNILFCENTVVDISNLISNQSNITYTILSGNNVTLTGNILDLTSALPGDIIVIRCHKGINTLQYPGETYKDVTITVQPKPDVNWISPLPSGLLNSDAPIDISSYASENNLGLGVSYYGSGVNDPFFDPSLAGSGEFDIVAEATTGYGCSDTAITTVTVNVDPNSLPKPSLQGLGQTHTNVVLQSGLGYDEVIYSLCDGQQTQFWISTSNLPPNIDSVAWYYSSNGNVNPIGHTHVTGTLNYTIPQSYASRTDYVYARYINGLGQEGPAASNAVNVVAPSYNTLINDTVCGDSNMVVDVQPNDAGMNGFTTSVTSLNISLQDPQFTTTRNYVWRDLNGNIIDTTYNFNRDLLSNKYEYVTVEEYTLLPNTNYIDLPNVNLTQNKYVINRQKCSYTDTVALVRNPEASFYALGQSNISYGTLVPFINTSTYEDWAEFNFSDGSPNYSTQVFGDTVLHYMNDMGFYDVLLVAKDYFGCQSDTIQFGMFYVEDWTGVEDNELVNSISTYPNPFLDKTTLEINSNSSTSAEVVVTNLLGEVVYSKNCLLSLGVNRVEVDLVGLSAGTYVMSVIANGNSINTKLIKE